MKKYSVYAFYEHSVRRCFLNWLKLNKRKIIKRKQYLTFSIFQPFPPSHYNIIFRIIFYFIFIFLFIHTVCNRLFTCNALNQIFFLRSIASYPSTRLNTLSHASRNTKILYCRIMGPYFPKCIEGCEM